MVHRQFCIYSLGWRQFSHLFNAATIEYAREFINPEGIYRNRPLTLTTNYRKLRTVVYDVCPAYFEYSHCLAIARFGAEKDQLDDINEAAELDANPPPVRYSENEEEYIYEDEDEDANEDIYQFEDED